MADATDPARTPSDAGLEPGDAGLEPGDAGLEPAAVAREGEPPGAAIVDLDLRGRALVRLVDAGPGDLRAVRRQLGPLPVLGGDGGPEATPPAVAARGREPDVTIRFVDRLAAEGAVRRVGTDARAIGDTFVLTRGRRQSDVRVAVPVDTLGSAPASLVAETGGRAIPLLLPILAASLLARGVAVAHASAFLLDGRGVLVSGWAKGGKSETLLAFLSNGARYVGDEWIFVDPDGPAMFGPPEPIRLWDWQLAMVPSIGRRVGRDDRLRLAATGGLARFLGGVGRAPGLGRTAPGEAARRAGAVVDRQRSRQFPVEELFGPDSVHPAAAAVDRVVLITGSDRDAIRRDVDPAEAAARIAATTAHELLDLEALRLAFRHAFPDRPAAGLEGLEGRLGAILGPAFARAGILDVRHAHPPDIPGLYRLIAPALE